MSLRKILLVVAFVAAAASVLWFVSDERNRHLVAGETHLAAGEEFLGVRLGTSLSSARQRLADGGLEEGPSYADILNNCGGRAIPDGGTVVRFVDRTWRLGKLCMVERDGVVISLHVVYARFII
jgi:hypothetical protein